MTPAEVARLHQFRDGFTLVDFAEVGLPVFRLTIEAVTTSHRAIPTIQEFVMRALSLGVEREDEVARMLGLKRDVVRAATDMLVGDTYVARQAAPTDLDSFRLTDAGRARLAQELLEVPQEEMLVVDYDGIRRAPVRLPGTSVVRAQELRAIGGIEIRPYPAEPPTVAELAIPDVTRVIRRQGGEDFRRTVLALKRIVRRNNVYREAVALVFAADRGAEVQVAFAIDGKLSEPHERAFAEHNGPRKMGFIKALEEGDARRRIERIVGKEVIRAGPDRVVLDKARREHADAEAEVRTLEIPAQGAGRSAPASVALRRAKDRLGSSIHSLQAMPVRPMAAHEQLDLLQEALLGAKRSLVITSAGFWPMIVNGYLLRELDRLAESGTAIRVETQLAPLDAKAAADGRGPLAELSKRAARGTLELVKVQRRELHFLVQDDELGVVTNRPFLGEIAPRNGFAKVEGIVTRRAPDLHAMLEALRASSEARRRDRA